MHFDKVDSQSYNIIIIIIIIIITIIIIIRVVSIIGKIKCFIIVGSDRTQRWCEPGQEWGLIANTVVVIIISIHHLDYHEN